LGEVCAPVLVESQDVQVSPGVGAQQVASTEADSHEEAVADDFHQQAAFLERVSASDPGSVSALEPEPDLESVSETA